MISICYLATKRPFPTFIFSAYGQQDRLYHVFICRGTFDIQQRGRVTLAEEQQSVQLADKYRTEPIVSSVEMDTDLVPFKLATDITVNAIARSKNLEPKEEWSVGSHGRLGGEYSESYRPRHWYYSFLGGWKISRPEQQQKFHFNMSMLTEAVIVQKKT